MALKDKKLVKKIRGGIKMEESYLKVSYHSVLDEETKFVEFYPNIELINYHTDEVKQIGRGIIYFINIFMYHEWNDIFFLADGISGDLANIIHLLEEPIQNETIFLNELRLSIK